MAKLLCQNQNLIRNSPWTTARSLSTYWTLSAFEMSNFHLFSQQDVPERILCSKLFLRIKLFLISKLFLSSKLFLISKLFLSSKLFLRSKLFVS